MYVRYLWCMLTQCLLLDTNYCNINRLSLFGMLPQFNKICCTYFKQMIKLHCIYQTMSTSHNLKNITELRLEKSVVFGHSVGWNSRGLNLPFSMNYSLSNWTWFYYHIFSLNYQLVWSDQNVSIKLYRIRIQMLLNSNNIIERKAREFHFIMYDHELDVF